jgi:hypothetical protein
VVEEPITQFVAGINEGTPSFWTDDTVHRKSPFGLELGDCGECSLAENARVIRVNLIIEGCEPILNVAYWFAAVALVVEPHESGWN